MRLILGTIGFLAVTLSGLAMPSPSWARDKEPQPCEWLIAPATEYNGLLRAVGRAARFVTDHSPIAATLIDEGRAAAIPLKLFYPMATSADKNMVILGSPFGSRSRARAILAEIQKFDDYFAGWGFVKPEKSAIVVSGWTGLPRFIPDNPMAWRAPIPLLSVGDLRAAMFVRRNVTKPVQALTKTVYLHERAHHLLHWTIRDGEFISEQVQVQEAFADFLPAFYLNIDPSTLSAAAQTDRWQSADTNPLRGTHTAVLPSILWRISRLMPEPRARVFFPHFIQELNRNAYSGRCWESWRHASLMTAAKYRASRNCAAALFLAVAQNLAPDLNFSPLIQNVEAELNIRGRTLSLLDVMGEPEPFTPFARTEEPEGPVVSQALFSGIVTYGQYLVSFGLYKVFAAMLGGG